MTNATFQLSMLDYNGVRKRPETESIALFATSEGSTNSYMDFRKL